MALTAAERQRRHRAKQQEQRLAVDVGELARAAIDRGLEIAWTVSQRRGLSLFKEAVDLGSFRRLVAVEPAGLSPSRLRGMLLVCRRFAGDEGEAAAIAQALAVSQAAHLDHARG
jgi:hypothetical protein